MSVFWVILVCIFPYSNWIRRDTDTIHAAFHVLYKAVLNTKFPAFLHIFAEYERFSSGCKWMAKFAWNMAKYWPEKHTETPLMQFKLLYKHRMKSVQIQEEMDQKKCTCLGTLHALKSSKPLQIAINCNRKTDLSGFNLPMV